MPKKMKNIEIILFLSLENGILGRVKFTKNPKKKKIQKEIKEEEKQGIIEHKDLLEKTKEEKPKIKETEQIGFNLEISKKIDEAINNKIKLSNIKIKHETIEIREPSIKTVSYTHLTLPTN